MKRWEILYWIMILICGGTFISFMLLKEDWEFEAPASTVVNTDNSVAASQPLNSDLAAANTAMGMAEAQPIAQSAVQSKLGVKINADVTEYPHGLLRVCAAEDRLAELLNDYLNAKQAEIVSIAPAYGLGDPTPWGCWVVVKKISVSVDKPVTQPAEQPANK